MAETYPTVHPGDLIKAELINRITADLETLKTKVAQLENTGGGTGAPAIDSLVPPDEVQMGGKLQIIGRNFGNPSQVTITVANELVDKKDIDLINSGDKLLVFTMPAIIGIPTEGKAVPIIVSNPNGLATASIILKPGQAADLFGLLTVNPAKPPTVPITANASFEWTVPVRVESTLPAVYVLTATVDQPTWKVDLIDLPGAISQGNLALAEQTIRQSPSTQPTDINYKVRVTIPVGVADGTEANLAFTIKARDKESFNGTRTTTITVGNVQPTPSDDVKISVGTVIPPAAKVEGFIEASAGDLVIIKFSVVVKRAGNYILKKFEAQNDATNKWTPRVVTGMTNNRFFIPAADQPFTLDTTLTGATGAPQTKLHLVIADEAETVSGFIEQPIRLKS